MPSRDRIHVLFVMHSFGTGGSERVVLDLARGLDPARFRSTVTAMHPGELLGAFQRHGIPAHCLHKQEGLDTALMRRLARTVRREGVRVINAHHFSPLVHACYAGLRNRCPAVYVEHSAPELRAVPRAWRAAGRLVLAGVYAGVGISAQTASEMRRVFRLPAGKVLTIPNAVDLKRFEDRGARDGKRRELGIDPATPVVGVVGNLRAQKNHALLFRAIRKVRETRKDVLLLVVGDGSEREALERLRDAEGLAGAVRLLGRRLDVPALYQAMDLYCLPSHYEGLPLSLLEAMASTLPVIGTRVEGILEVIEDGVNGRLVEPDDPDALAGAILALLGDAERAGALARSGRAWVQANHGMGPWLRRYEDLFAAAAARGAAPPRPGA